MKKRYFIDTQIQFDIEFNALGKGLFSNKYLKKIVN